MGFWEEPVFYICLIFYLLGVITPTVKNLILVRIKEIKAGMKISKHLKNRKWK